jgi:hypothetical protein
MTMDIFQNLFLRSTDPRTTFGSLISGDVGLSILLHSLAYAFLATTLGLLPWDTAFPLMVGVMTFGYIGRLWRSKALYQALGQDLEKTLGLMHTAYFQWYFLG